MTLQQDERHVHVFAMTGLSNDRVQSVPFQIGQGELTDDGCRSWVARGIKRVPHARQPFASPEAHANDQVRVACLVDLIKQNADLVGRAAV